MQPVIAIERIVYHRERAAGMYAAMPYALAQGDVEVPYLLVQALLWSVITYWMFGFEASAGEDRASGADAAQLLHARQTLKAATAPHAFCL